MANAILNFHFLTLPLVTQFYITIIYTAYIIKISSEKVFDIVDRSCDGARSGYSRPTAGHDGH